MAGVRKVRFYHYLLTIIWPPLVLFFVGRPFIGTIAFLLWIPWGFGLLIPTFGLNWLGAILGQVITDSGFFKNLLSFLGMNLAAWHRLRMWERGYEFLD